jgi:hypothetical protein
MFAGRSVVSSVLRRSVVSTSSSRSFVVPVLSVFKNVNQPKIVTSIFSRGYITSGILSVNDDASEGVPKPRMQPATSPDGTRSSLFIGNLDFSITEQALLDMCEGVLGPDIATRARVAVDRESGTYSIKNVVVKISVVRTSISGWSTSPNRPSPRLSGSAGKLCSTLFERKEQ